VKLFSKNSNLCDHNPPTSQTDGQTDGQTTCDRNTALCTKVHRAVKTLFAQHYKWRLHKHVPCHVSTTVTNHSSADSASNSILYTQWRTRTGEGKRTIIFQIYRVAQNSKPQTVVHIFAKYWPWFSKFLHRHILWKICNKVISSARYNEWKNEIRGSSTAIFPRKSGQKLNFKHARYLSLKLLTSCWFVKVWIKNNFLKISRLPVCDAWQFVPNAVG